MERLYSDVKLYYSDTDFIGLKIKDITINSSNDTLTDTCVIEVSQMDTSSDSGSVTIQGSTFRIGSKVSVSIGYYTPKLDYITNVFNGYLTGWSTKSDSLVLNFDDRMYLFKSCTRIKKSYQSGKTLTEIVDLVIKDAGITEKINKKVIDIKAGNFQINDGYYLPSEILSLIKERYGIYCYFRKDSLYIGHRYWHPYEEKYKITGDDMAQTYQFKYPNTTEKPYHKIIEMDAQYVVIDKNQYKVKGSSTYTVNGAVSGITYEYPENIKDPVNVSTIKVPDTDLATLKELVKNAFNKLDFGGFTGKLTLFGYPVINHGDIISLEVDLSKIKNSPRIVRERYFVDEVVRRFGSQGYRQEITIGNMKI